MNAPPGVAVQLVFIGTEADQKELEARAILPDVRCATHTAPSLACFTPNSCLKLASVCSVEKRTQAVAWFSSIRSAGLRACACASSP